MRIKEFDYSSFKLDHIKGRYINYETTIACLSALVDESKIQTIGHSVNSLPIPMITLGTGSKKILMWSQMHGNETTTTKAVLDLLSFFKSKSQAAISILDKAQLYIIPVLSPDGANQYTRVNANEVDLNRDAQERSQPESKALRAVFDTIKPDYCFNLHDQRTLFNVGDSDKVATVSFLSPAADQERSITESRIRSMKLIADMNDVLQQYIPGGVGRYDDSFNINCVGDSFQYEQVPTILFESGHYPQDYNREQTRALITLSLITALNSIVYELYEFNDVEAYHNIPENDKLFYDILIENPHVIDDHYKEDQVLAINYAEILEDHRITFIPKPLEIKPKGAFYGHKVYDMRIESDRNEVILHKLLPLFD